MSRWSNEAWFHAKHRSKRGKKPLLLSVFVCLFLKLFKSGILRNQEKGFRNVLETLCAFWKRYGFIVRVDRFSDGSHGSLPWLAWLACMARWLALYPNSYIKLIASFCSALLVWASCNKWTSKAVAHSSWHEKKERQRCSLAFQFNNYLFLCAIFHILHSA